MRRCTSWPNPWCDPACQTLVGYDMVLEHLGDALAELHAALHELAEPQVRPYQMRLVSIMLMEECTRRCMS